MRKGKRFLTISMIIALLTCWSTPSMAENALRDIFENALYGGLAGALVGGALLAFTKKPGDHLDYLAYGGSGGVLLGATYGVVKASRSLAEYENGRVKFALPTVIPDFLEASARGQATVAIKADLFRGSF